MQNVRAWNRLLPAERRLWRAYARRVVVDLRTGDPEADDPARGARWGRERIVRAPVLTALLSGAVAPRPGSVPGVRLFGARILGDVDLRDAVLAQSLQLEHCDITGTLTLTDATTKAITLRGNRMHRLQAGRVQVQGSLSVSDSTVLEGIELADAYIAGQLRMNRADIGPPSRATLAADTEAASLPDGESTWAVWAGGLSTGGGLFARHMQCHGGLRLLGARLRGGLHLQHCRLTARGSVALEGSHLEAGLVELSRGFTAEGIVRLRSARISGVLSFDRAVLRPADVARLAVPPRVPELVVHLSHARVEELIFLPERIRGEVNLSYTRFGVLFDHPSSYPGTVRLTGTTYEQLRGQWTLEQRCAWAGPDGGGGYRPQPYEQLAAWYQSFGGDGEARRVLLAKQRAQRRTQGPAGRLWGLLLDGVVGYGYRSWLAALWAGLLLATGTLVFHAVPPEQIPLDEQRDFHAFVYTLDLLVPVSVFEQRGAWQPAGWTQWLAWSLIACGWILATALIAGVTRVLRPAPSGN